MHAEWYLRHEKTAGWKCRACDDPRRWDTTKCESKSLWFGASICYQCNGVRYRHSIWVMDWIIVGDWIDCHCD